MACFLSENTRARWALGCCGVILARVCEMGDGVEMCEMRRVGEMQIAMRQVTYVGRRGGCDTIS